MYPGFFLEIFLKRGKIDQKAKMYAPRAYFQCCGITLEDHGYRLLDYVHVAIYMYVDYKV